jgi:hypothetical protein
MTAASAVAYPTSQRFQPTTVHTPVSKRLTGWASPEALRYPDFRHQSLWKEFHVKSLHGMGYSAAGILVGLKQALSHSLRLLGCSAAEILVGLKHSYRLLQKTKHGRYSKQSIEERARYRSLLRHCREALGTLGF